MQLNNTGFLRKAQHPLLLAMASLPAAMLLTLAMAPGCFPWCWCLPGGYVLCAWLCLLIPGRKRLIAAAAASVLMAAGSLALLPWRAQVLLLLLPAMYIALLLWTLPIGGWPHNRELPIGWHVGGVLTHLTLQVLINISRAAGNGVYTPAQTPLLISFLAYAALVLLALNRASLDSAAQSRRKVPLLMQRQNRIITLTLLLVSLLVAAIPAIGAALRTSWDVVTGWLLRLLSLLAALVPLPSGGGGSPGGGGAADMDFGESQPPSAFALLMEKIVSAAVQVIVIVALLLLAYVVGRKLWKLLKLLWARMLRYSAAASEDYEDEITSTRDESDTEREGLLTRLRRSVPIAEKGGTPAQQVRLRYRQLRRKHADWSAAATARETIPPEAAALYERARYAGHDLTDEEAARFREGTKRL